MASMEGSCRRNIRKAVRCGLRIRECKDDTFVDHYYAQLEDVFAKDGLVPTYGKKRVRALMRHLLPEAKVLPLQAIDAEGNCIASMITVASNDSAFLWGSTSWRRFQYLRPNELLMWSSIQHWKSRGIKKLDMGGGGEYKRKYGGYEISGAMVARVEIRRVGKPSHNCRSGGEISATLARAFKEPGNRAPNCLPWFQASMPLSLTACVITILWVPQTANHSH